MSARAPEGLEPHRVTGYLEGLARLAHAWYHKYRVLGEPQEAARLVLAAAVRQVLGNGLHLLGINAPDRMGRESARGGLDRARLGEHAVPRNRGRAPLVGPGLQQPRPDPAP